MFKLLWRMLRGGSLTRRERRLLVRATADVFRIFPFIVIVVVPFLEFALPVILKLFPNFLPTQFRDRLKQQENLKRELVARVHLAEFLQDTVSAIAKKKIKEGEKVKEAEDLLVLLQQAREGKRLSNKELLSVAQLFGDDITLDNMGRPQLISLCKFLGIGAYGSDSFLSSQLQRRIEQIRADDKMIDDEGILHLTEEELITACRERGMRSSGLTEAGYRRNLKQWIDLSLHQQVPVTLLILSRAFTISERRPDTELEETLLSLDENVVNEVRATAGLGDTKEKLELLKRENEIIQAEFQEREHDEKIALEADNLEREVADAMAKELDLDAKLAAVTENLSALASPSAVAKERKKLSELKKKEQDTQKLDELE